MKEKILVSLLVIVGLVAIGLALYLNPQIFRASLFNRVQTGVQTVGAGIPSEALKYQMDACASATSQCVSVYQSSSLTGLQFPGAILKIKANLFYFRTDRSNISCVLSDNGAALSVAGSLALVTDSNPVYTFSDYALPDAVGGHDYSVTCTRSVTNKVCPGSPDINTPPPPCVTTTNSDPAVTSLNSIHIDITKCGNGTTDAGEQCDKGSANTDSYTCPYGSGTCTYCNTQCKNMNATGPSCGDKKIQSPEKCDTDQFGSETCATQNPLFNAGALTCENNCTSIGVKNCAHVVCGNGIVESGESCDDGSNDGIGCATGCGASATGWTCNVPSGQQKSICSCAAGYTGSDCHQDKCYQKTCQANSACNASNGQCVCNNGYDLSGSTCVQNLCYGKTCQANSACSASNGQCVCNLGYEMTGNVCTPLCGNGRVDSGEACDGTNLNGQTCPAGLSGTPTCSADCKSLVTSACAANSITNCPVTLLAGYSHPHAHKNMKLFASGASSTFSWKLDGVAVPNTTGNFVRFVGLSTGSHTVTLNDSVTCGPFIVDAYNSTDVTKANSLSVNASWSPLELLLYDWNGDGAITATACPAPSATSNTVVKSDKLGIYGATQGNTSTTCP